MASPRQQRQRSNRAREFGERLFQRELGAWTGAVVAEWTPGTTRIPVEAETELSVVLRRGYDRVANRFLGEDYRIYKQDEPSPFDEAMRAIATILAVAFADRIVASSAAILSTLRTMMGRASDAAEAGDVDPAARSRVARMDLTRRMRAHRIIIGVTESNWTVNTTHRTAILSVNDPLSEAIERIAQLFESGDTAAARRLAREVERLAKLPTSVSQGKLIGTVSDVRDRLVTPLVQARLVATMRAQRDRLGTQEKRWVAIFRNTRPSHAAAHGQVKPIDEPFEVGGSLMQAPMDGSLGAPTGEIVNCQCMTEYI
jgi:hypothetical protein